MGEFCPLYNCKLHMCCARRESWPQQQHSTLPRSPLWRCKNVIRARPVFEEPHCTLAGRGIISAEMPGGLSVVVRDDLLYWPQCLKTQPGCWDPLTLKHPRSVSTLSVTSAFEHSTFHSVELQLQKKLMLLLKMSQWSALTLGKQVRII